jgi:hypothetical protein
MHISGIWKQILKANSFALGLICSLFKSKMTAKKKKDWFKLKRYPHIGLPLNSDDRNKWIETYVSDPLKIAQHSFLPFIHRTSRVKKFRKRYNSNTGKLEFNIENGKKISRYPKEKKRELFYASHLDSLIFSYYAHELNNKYDYKIKNEPFQLDEVVNAYRSVPVNPNKEDSSNKCNIDFANDVFKYILQYEQPQFSVIAFDISSFFDNLDHKILRDIWCDVLNVKKLPDDHFNIYKNITRFSHVDIVDIFEEFKDKIYTQKTSKLGGKLMIKRKKIDEIRFMKNQSAIAFCSKKDFFKVKNKLLQPSKTKIKDGKLVRRNFGIPQGSPISSVLANIYLLHFDKLINDLCTKIGGIYRRYSDDMVVVCPSAEKIKILETVYSEIKNYKLEIQPIKTQIFHFEKSDGKLKCGEEYNNGTVINWNKNFIYLGFEFDGQHVLLKSASLSGFYRKMKRGVRRAKHFEKITGKGLFRRRLLKRHSYKGAKRIRKYLWSEKEKKFIKTEIYNWGNFLSYANKASNIMVCNKIKNQTKRHWTILNREITK